ncbi:MAG: hypothetical protein V1676_03830 [Candidatus Diapherotrites archaeon]
MAKAKDILGMAVDLLAWGVLALMLLAAVDYFVLGGWNLESLSLTYFGKDVSGRCVAYSQDTCSTNAECTSHVPSDSAENSLWKLNYTKAVCSSGHCCIPRNATILWEVLD